VTSIATGQEDASLQPAERRAIVLATVFRVAGTPVIALAGLVNTAIIVHQTGEAAFGFVSLVTTLGVLMQFADQGIGAAVITACSGTRRLRDDAMAVATVQRGMHALSVVAVGAIVISVIIMATDSWGSLLGGTTGPADRVAITVAVCLIALSVPAAIGIRILIGLDRNPLAVLLTMSSTVFTLLITLGLKGVGITGIWYALSGTAGVLIANCLATAVALAISGLGWSVFARPGAEFEGRKLLRGSIWMFLVGVGLPLGLQSHRLILSHVSTAAELSRYALMAQVYAIIWTVFVTGGMALWPVFVKRRTDTDASTRLWLRMVAVFGGLSGLAAIGIVVLGPWTTSVISGGELVASRSLAVAFAALLVIQCIHFPAGMMLTTPHEARWQAYCVMAMGVTAVALGLWWGGMWGGVGVVAAAAVAVAAAQLAPDFVWVPRLLRRRARDIASSSGGLAPDAR